MAGLTDSIVRKLCVVGLRTAWRTTGDGEFFCPKCGGDRNYRRCTGTRRFTVLGVPILPRGTYGPMLECSACGGLFAVDALDHPTTTRLSAMLRDAVHTITLAVLAAGGAQSPEARSTAVETLRAAGFPDCVEEQLLALLAALASAEDTPPVGGGEAVGTSEASEAGAPGSEEPEPQAAAMRGPVGPEPGSPVPADPFPGPGLFGRTGLSMVLEMELHELLGSLAPHLSPAGRENLLLQGARIASADGPYQPAERDVLDAIARGLQLSAADTSRLLGLVR